MSYKTTNDLPSGVKDNLPQKAQEIYQAAYNNAWEEYKNPEKRRDDTPREEVAHRVAWAAVKNVYEKKDNGRWHKKQTNKK